MEKQALQSRLWSVVRHVPVILMASIFGTVLNWWFDSPSVREITSYSYVFGENLMILSVAYVAAYAVYRFGEGRSNGRIWMVARPAFAIIAAGFAFLFLLTILDYISGNPLDIGGIFTRDSFEFGVVVGAIYYMQLWIARHGIGLAIPKRVYQTPW